MSNEKPGRPIYIVTCVDGDTTTGDVWLRYGKMHVFDCDIVRSPDGACEGHECEAWRKEHGL